MNSRPAWEYEWDEEKNRASVARGRPDFSEVAKFKWDTAVYWESDRFDETRWLAVGYLDETLHVVVYTIRDDRRRIISFRRASNRERRDYASA